MRRADRLFQLVQLLRSRHLVTAEALADELGVSKRTVYRDIRDLERSGVPVRGEAGVGYRMETGFDLPPLTFNANEIEALVLGARMVEAFGDEELARAARSAMTKIQGVVPPPLRRAIDRTALYAPNMPWRHRRAEFMAPVRSAIGAGRKLGIRYERADGEGSNRVIRPLALFFWGRDWTIGAFCELRWAYRNFRLDRIVEADVLDDRFDGADGIDLDGYLERMEEEELQVPLDGLHP